MLTKQSFSDHINELRLRLLVWFIFFILGSVIGFIKSNFLLTLLVKPLGESLFYTSPMGGFNFVMQTAILFGFLVSLPILTYEIIKFCQPILSENVKKIVPKLVFFSFCLLIISLLVGFYFFIPAAIHFLKGFGNGQIQALITTSEYFSFIMIYLIGLGILFQMPVIILLINYAHQISIKQLMKWQKIMIVSSFIVAAILTPTPDPVNQTIMALPIIILYELSVFLVWMVNKDKKPFRKDTFVWYFFIFFLVTIITMLVVLDVLLISNK
ncbi:MAG: twin-arginine translocase subunit TatC [Patescibacteria group bacterium]|nr:twin-arginine translocase subunit TatC [Patescibacteria group bacterium]